jgi:hypothetical protein
VQRLLASTSCPAYFDHDAHNCPLIVNVSHNMCRAEVQRLLASTSCPAYFQAVEAAAEAEEERAKAVLDPDASKDKLVRLLLDVYVAQQARDARRLCYLVRFTRCSA